MESPNLSQTGGAYQKHLGKGRKRERQRGRRRLQYNLYISKRLSHFNAQKFLFQRELQRGNIRHPLFLFFSLLTSIGDKWGCGPDSVDKLVISGWSERHSSLEFFPSDLHFFFSSHCTNLYSFPSIIVICNLHFFSSNIVNCFSFSVNIVICIFLVIYISSFSPLH